MGYFIDNMMDADKIKYKERSICAINGIRQLISDIQLILSCNTIKGKYYQIAQYIGLATENEKSYYNYFIPINSDIVFLLRFSDHNNTNPSLYNQHERNGRPNKRFIIPFVGNIFQNSGPTPFLGAEHHVVSYPVNALDDEASIKLFLSDLQRLFTNGETNFTQLPQQPIQENNKQNTNKNIMKINESQLRKIIKESVKNVLNEMSVYKDGIRHVFDTKNQGMEGNTNYSYYGVDNGKWRYEGDDMIDRLMWRLKKTAQSNSQVRNDGWPTFEYILNTLNVPLIGDFNDDESFEFCVREFIKYGENYTLPQLYSFLSDVKYFQNMYREEDWGYHNVTLQKFINYYKKD